MISRYVIDCSVGRPDWPFVPFVVPCGSARTIGITGIRSRFGVTVTGCRVRITNASGVSMVKNCVKDRGAWCCTFPASHFQTYGTVKNGVVVMVVGKDETNAEQTWIERIGDLKVEAWSTDAQAGSTVVTPRDVYHKSEVVDGVQHYKKEILTFSQIQNAWGSEYVGDYIFLGGEYVEVENQGGEA